MSEAERLEKQYDEMLAGSILRDIGFSYQEVALVKDILKKENIPLKALLRQALQQWQGVAITWDKKDLMIFGNDA